MGYGGDLVWSAVVRNISDQTKKPIVPCHTPKLSDLLVLCLYDRGHEIPGEEIFRHNPRIERYRIIQKSFFEKKIDYFFDRLIDVSGLRRFFEQCIVFFAQRGKKVFLHLDMTINSYAASSDEKKMIWKTGGHAIDILTRQMGYESQERLPEMYFSDEERQTVGNLLSRAGVLRQPFIVIDPNTNKDWFGDLRAWPEERWRLLIKKIHEIYGDRVKIVQTGVGQEPVLSHVIDLRNKTSFRQASLLIQASSLFIGQEGGLMHAARSVGVPALIIWGGLTLPEFAGYPEYHNVVCHYVDCAPCGLRGACPFGKKCLTMISVEEVFLSVSTILDQNLIKNEKTI